MSYNLRSLFTTGLFGLMMPLCLIAGLFMAFLLMGIIPFLQEFSAHGMAHFIHVLQTFGNGSVLQGCLVIGITFSGVSTLFDMCNLLVLSKPIR